MLTLGLGTTMEPTVCQAPMLHARQYYAVCREIQGTCSKLISLLVAEAIHL